MTNSPAARMEAKAHREYQKLDRAFEELRRVGLVIKDSDLPGDIKLRLYAALQMEHDFIHNQQEQLTAIRKSAEISRGKTWVNHSRE